MTNPTLIDQARLLEALEPLETPTRCYCSQEFGLHHNPACRLSGRVTAENYVSAPGYRRVALTETAASPGSGDGWRCFFCDEHFTDETLARDHFGFLGWEPGCVNKLVQSDQSRRAELVRTEIAFRKAIAERNEAREALAKLEALTSPSKEGDE
jgi:hypothetical protein